MSFPLDRRTRRYADVRLLTIADFFANDFPTLAARNGALVVRGIDTLKPRLLSVTVGDESWTVAIEGGELVARPGIQPGTYAITFNAEQFSDWAQDQRSLYALQMAGQLPRSVDNERDLSIWDTLWRALVEGWPVVDDIEFLDRNGQPLDLATVFTPADDPADVAHFLREAGYLHLRGWAEPALMEQISAEVDAAVPNFVEGDGRSWWATVTDGSMRCVRIQDFLDYSPGTVELLTSAGWDDVRRIMAADDDLMQRPVEGRCIEALIKPVGVIAGPSDVSFHRDCHFGRHAYGCSSTVVGVSLTASNEENGQLRVIAGSHRVAVPVEIAKTSPYLPRVALATEPGDLTVHLSCTLHESTPPQVAERKVMYGGFSLAKPADDVAGSDALGELREDVYKILLDNSGAST